MPWRVYLMLAGLTILVAGINITSRLIENPPGERAFESWEPVVWEVSSAILLLLLAPLVHLAFLRWPPLPWRRETLLVHLALTIPFSLLHVAGMVSLRLGSYRLMGSSYQFGSHGVPLALFYEWRKDVLSYALLLALFWIDARLRQREALPLPAPEEERRFSLKTDGGTLHLRPGEIWLVEAAGNYVEVHSDHGVKLSRMTLAAAEAALGPPFLRIHRSRLVNRDLIRAEKPQPSGDVLLELANGEQVMASRRFRERLPSAA